jgi:hypothetical protein
VGIGDGVGDAVGEGVIDAAEGLVDSVGPTVALAPAPCDADVAGVPVAESTAPPKPRGMNAIARITITTTAIPMTPAIRRCRASALAGRTGERARCGE